MSRWVSTRSSGGSGASFVDALFHGLAPDGGLYVLREIPPMDAGTALREATSFPDLALRIAVHVLGDEVPGEILGAAVEEALDFPVPLVTLDLAEGPVRILELFHGPSLAFKDVGARFMAALMDRLDPDRRPGRPRTVLVATSGDTGSAVARAFHGREGFRVVVLFPREGVSDVQRRLFTTLGGNVTSLAVDGDFDDCQRMVKEAFGAGGAALRLTSANSINAGRLVPQIFYYAEALRLLSREEAPGTGEPARPAALDGGAVLSVPSGNLGNLTAGLLARRLGFPVRSLVASTNANDGFRRWLQEGDATPRPAVRTASNAMDVARPSNLERIRWLVDDDRDALAGEVTSFAFDDDATLECMARVEEQTGYVLDPHGAVGVLGAVRWQGMQPPPPGRSGPPVPVVALATAHPAKFPDVVRRAVGREPPVPERLARALEAGETIVEVEPTVEALMEILRSGPGAGRRAVGGDGR